MSSSPPSKTFAALVRELRGLRQHHGLRNPARVAEAPALLAATTAIRGPDESNLALAAKGLLCELIAELGGEDTAAASAAYGLGADNDAPTLTRRRSDLAVRFNVTARTLQRHEERIIETIAFRLLERAQAVQVRNGRPLLGAGEKVTVDWLVRFESYYRIWSDLTGLANDLDGYYRGRGGGSPGDRDLTTYIDTSLWYFARFLLHLDRFQYDHGGLWLLSNAEAELTTSDAVYRIAWHAPTSEFDDSWLRTALTLAPGEELGFFLTEVHESDDGPAIYHDWSDWITVCTCPCTEPVGTCDPHAVVRLCRAFCTVIDSEWLKVAGWYRTAPRPSET